MTGWVLVLAFTFLPRTCPFPAGALDVTIGTRPDIVKVFAGHLRTGERITVRLMDNQKLKGEFVGMREDRLLFRPDRDRDGNTLPVAFRAIHSIEVRRGGFIARP